jgi:hypothetical protein
MSRRDLLKIYDRILSRYYSGSLDFVLFLTIRVQYENHQIKKDDIFAKTVMESAFYTAMLALADLIRNKDGISLHYLINEFKHSRAVLDTESYNRFVAFADEFEKALSLISKTVDQIFILRNKIIAHTDKKQATNPSFFLENLTTTVKDLENAFSVIESSILEIGEYLEFNKTVQRDMITLTHLALRNRTLAIFSSQNLQSM